MTSRPSRAPPCLEERMTTLACRGCGTPVAPKAGRGGRPRKWCSQACANWVRRHPGVLRPTSRACRLCSADLSGRSMKALYCSRRCGEVAQGKRLSECYGTRFCALPECGKLFQPARQGQRCCSEKHGKVLYNRESRADGRQKPPPWTDARRDRYHQRRARKKQASTGEPVLLEAIAERDRWRCHLCRKRVGKAIAWPHPRSASLDHLVPLSRGGTHDPANVRLAHLSCNSSKGSRAVGEQLLLIG